MSSTSENETEILLGNKHLLAIFFVLAVLLGIAFTGGYMIGRNSSDKRPASPTDSVAVTSRVPASIETHTIAPPGDSTEPPKAADTTPTHTADPELVDPTPPSADKQKPGPEKETFTGPHEGETYLQVAALPQTEAIAMAGALSKKGFRARAVPAPGPKNLYRVMIGPTRDATDLSTTRDSLRKAGFTTIIPRRY